MKYFYLLPPENLPSCQKELYTLATTLEIINNIIQLPCDIANDHINEFVKINLEILTPELKSITPILEDEKESIENKANDKAFNIVRANGNISLILLYSVLQGFNVMLNEVLTIGTNLTEIEWGKIRYSYLCLFFLLSGKNIKIPELIPIKRKSLSLAKLKQNNASYNRWITGHYMFMNLTQGLIISLSCYRNSFENGEINDSKYYLQIATMLMAGAEIALKFTGDSNRELYEKNIRPTLMPPIAPPHMSGLKWRDHEFLIKLLRNLTPIFCNTESPIFQDVLKFRETFAKTYDAHKNVCSKFVGTERI